MTRTPLAASIASLIIGALLVQPMSSLAQQLAGGSTEAAVNRELARRMQRSASAEEEMARGQEALRKRDYETAFARYKNACEFIPASAAAVAPNRKAAVDGFTTAGIKLAEQRVTEGYYASAAQVLQEVLKQNPDSKPVLKLLANIEAPDYFNKQMTPGHRAKVEEVKQAFIAAKGYQDLGRYGLAERKYEDILNKDPYNVAAHKGREEVANLKNRAALAGYDSARAMAMWEVEREWTRPYRRFDRKAAIITTDTKSSAASTIQITRKLNLITIPKVDFKDATIREAVEFLVKKSKELDPESTGVNIVLKLGDEAGGSAPPPPAPAPSAIPGIPGLDVPGVPSAPVPAPAPAGGSGTRITLTLNNVPLIEVIKYITNLANLKYKIEPFAISIVPLGTQTEDLVIKEWKVPPSLMRTPPAGPEGGAAPPGGGGAGFDAPGTTMGGTANAKEWLTAAGVVFGQGAFAMYSPASSSLLVKNTPEQLEVVERIIENADVNVVRQVEIQAKFVEITQNNLKELGFDWLLGAANVNNSYNVFAAGGTSGTAQPINTTDYVFNLAGSPIGQNPVTAGNRSGQVAIGVNAIDALLFGVPGASKLAPGIFSLAGVGTDPSFQVIMRGLDQRKGIDLLSAPRVTTKSGQRAVIEVIRSFIYPTEFSAPQIPQTVGATGGGGGGVLGGGTSNSFPVTPTTPTSFEKKDVGVTLEVEPTIGPDGYSIDMQLAPQVVEFEGFINYGSPIQTTSTNPITGITSVNVLTPNIINQPIFSTRKVSTNVTVFDGATVVLGGLIREDVQKVEDKTPIIGDIPYLGRLFRTNVDQHIKRNLVIFVTARLVNPEGAPIMADDEKEESVDALPLPDIAPPPIDGKTFRPVDGKGYRPIQTYAPAPAGQRSGALNPAARRLEP
jgi:general secretion pathway protein D